MTRYLLFSLGLLVASCGGDVGVEPRAGPFLSAGVGREGGQKIFEHVGHVVEVRVEIRHRDGGSVVVRRAGAGVLLASRPAGASTVIFPPSPPIYLESLKTGICAETPFNGMGGRRCSLCH